MTKVKKDQHSLYVRAGGYQFRPVHSSESGTGCRHVYKEGSLTKEGDEVKARHKGGTSLGQVTLADGTKEIWFSHGSGYIDFKDGKSYNRKSEELWDPYTPPTAEEITEARKIQGELLARMGIRPMHIRKVKDQNG